MTGYYSRRDELKKMIEKNLERQGVRDPKVRREMAEQRINTWEALGILHREEDYLTSYGKEAFEIHLMRYQTSNLPKLDQETYLNSRRMAHPSLIPLPEEGYSDGKRR
jgi:hypothetical protein